ncbi:MAG: tetratricopeptide repeat protein [Candidatus Omnitrophota bacterium]
MFNLKPVAKISVFTTLALFFILGSAFAETAKEAYDKGVDLYNQNKYDYAIIELTKAININPNNLSKAYLAAAYSLRGLIYSYGRDVNQAILDYSKAIELDPIYTSVYERRGLLYEKEGNYDQAILDYTKGIEISPTNDNFQVSFQLWRGRAYFHKGDYDKAISDYTKVIEFCTKNTPACYMIDSAVYLSRGEAYAAKGNYDQAILDYTKGIEISSTTAPFLGSFQFRRGEAYFHKGDYDKAWEDVHRGELSKAKADPAFLDKLKKASGREK